MSSTTPNSLLASQEDLDELKTLVAAIGGTVLGLLVLLIILLIVVLVFLYRAQKQLNSISLMSKTIRLDSRKTLESVEKKSPQRNPVLNLPPEDNDDDGSQSVTSSSIFTRKLFNNNNVSPPLPSLSPLPGDVSIVRTHSQGYSERGIEVKRHHHRHQSPVNTLIAMAEQEDRLKKDQSHHHRPSSSDLKVPHGGGLPKRSNTFYGGY